MPLPLPFEEAIASFPFIYDKGLPSIPFNMTRDYPPSISNMTRDCPPPLLILQEIASEAAASSHGPSFGFEEAAAVCTISMAAPQRTMCKLETIGLAVKEVR